VAVIASRTYSERRWPTQLSAAAGRPNRRGERCRVRVVNAAGYCVAHDPQRPGNMRELGKASARACSRPKAARVPQGLREYLRENVPPQRVWQAIEAAWRGPRFESVRPDGAPRAGYRRWSFGIPLL
jgi:hypothetical protein